MNQLAAKALLPAGLRDLLPPHAAFEAAVKERLVVLFGARGFDRVDPPLVEFEESLLSGGGAATSPQTFRLMDPVSQRMMGVRADMTPQVARIAASRLAHVPRPLRLAYAGQVLRVRGTQLRSRRQFAQVGAELIGSPSPLADVEVVAMAVEALDALGVKDLSVDLGLPTLVPAACEDLNIPEARAQALRDALDRKDAAAVAALGEGPVFAALLAATGPAERALDALNALALGPRAARERDALAEVVRGVGAAAPGLGLTIDPVENRGFEYHTGVTFAFFSRSAPGELGRGGRYLAGGEGGEPATGLTLFMDAVAACLPAPAPARRILVPAGAPTEAARALRAEGWITLGGLAPPERALDEARRMGCEHVMIDGGVQDVSRTNEEEG